MRPPYRFYHRNVKIIFLRHSQETEYMPCLNSRFNNTIRLICTHSLFSKSRQNGVGGLKNGSSFHAIEDIAETWPGEVTEKYHLRQVTKSCTLRKIPFYLISPCLKFQKSHLIEITTPGGWRRQFCSCACLLQSRHQEGVCRQDY